MRKPVGHSDQFILRMPHGMRNKIADVAKAKERSMNREIVAFLERVFYPRPPVLERLDLLIKQFDGRGWTLARMAEGIGEKSEAVENVCAGKGSFTFSQLNKIADLFGARADWLKHSDGEMFPVAKRFGFSANDGFEYIKLGVEKIHLIRSTARQGELLVVIEHRDGKFETFSTDLHRIRVNWAGGRVEDADFANACCQLQQEHRDRLFGHLLDDSKMPCLLRGTMHLHSFVTSRLKSSWVYDWWDLDRFGRQRPDHYWEGYGAFCMQTKGDVEANERQKAERAAILAGQWEPGRFR
ncbi:Arc family DNA-binding protein [uncultured Rhodoblastus sp.]|uniref:Arc family DNA-binding protein n=1 Tax=uncultured Rhodoblastus sp. TaxID=543037 RepID=UPI0025F0245C|nr:Arc family DNA-binding protein [uncultured Rhodoblastus sp.]